MMCEVLLVPDSNRFLVSSGSLPEQHQNFEESQEAMKQQLLQLSVLLKALDPELCDFLGQSLSQG